MRRIVFVVTALTAALIVAGVAAQQPRPAREDQNLKPFPPFHIVGNLYYVGMYEHASYLITTPEGSILINTGVPGTGKTIRANIESLGFKVSDIKILLAMHAHWDHVGDMAEMKRITGAKFMMEEKDVPVVEDGGVSDYRFPGGGKQMWEPVKVDRVLKDGDKIKLGGVELTALHHPGHTKGTTSFTYTVRENGKSYNVGIINIDTVNEETKLTNTPSYPNIIADYTSTFEKQLKLNPDVWVSAHAHHYNLHGIYQPGDAYDPNRWKGYREAVLASQKEFQERLAKERAEQKTASLK
jgi:metallo-beta-lactamase class B